MDVQFAGQLDLIETDRAFETALPVSVIQTVRRRLVLLRAAPSPDTLSKWRSARLALASNENGIGAIWIADNWKMTVRFDVKCSPNCVEIQNIEKVVEEGELP